MPYRAVAAEALERWREAHRRLDAAAEGSPEWQQATIDVERAKTQYQAAIDDALNAHTPAPPPFDDAIG
jgi:hypothetical protein